MPVDNEYRVQWPETVYWQPDLRHLWLIPHKCGSTSFRVSGASCRRWRGETPDITFLVMRDPIDRLISGLNQPPGDISRDMVFRRDKTIFPVSKQYEGIHPDVVLRLEDSKIWGPKLCMLFGYPVWTRQNKGPRRGALPDYYFEDLPEILEYYDEDYDIWEKRGAQWESDLHRFS